MGAISKSLANYFGMLVFFNRLKITISKHRSLSPVFDAGLPIDCFMDLSPKRKKKDLEAVKSIIEATMRKKDPFLSDWSLKKLQTEVPGITEVRIMAERKSKKG